MDALAQLKESLAQASRAFISLDAHYVQGPATEVRSRSSTGMPGADALLDFVDRKTAIPAPVEASEVARALLSAIAAVDMLEDAIEAAQASVPNR